MSHTACTEPQCLYKGALYLYLRVELHLYSSYGPYSLYKASVPVQGCTLPLPKSRAIPLLLLWAVQPVQSLSACTRVHFTFLYPSPLLVPWSRKSRAIPLLPLLAVQPVQSLGVCTRVHFTFLYPSPPSSAVVKEE